MPVKLMTQDMLRRMATRAFLYGPPNTLKTTSILATAYYPLTILSLPGESGWGTIPANIPGLTSYVWESSPGDPVTAASIKRDVETLVKQLVVGKDCRTLAVEGLHKWHGIYMDVATDGSYGRGEEFEPAKYGRAHQLFTRFVQDMLISGPVEYLIVTSWNAREADRHIQPGEKARDVSTHEWPDLPGKMAKQMAGMFSLLVFSRVKPVPGQPGLLRGEWLLRPDSEVWGASIKVDPRVIAKLPQTVPQDWKNLYKIVGQAEEEVAQEEKVA